LFQRELLNHLRLAVVKELEILLVEIANRVSFLVAHDGTNQDKVHPDPESGGFVARANLLDGIGRRLGRAGRGRRRRGPGLGQGGLRTYRQNR
jgi:hypothetical protein